MKHFHAHIYFEPKDLQRAHALLRSAQQMEQFEGAHIRERPVGPHPAGMIEVRFSESAYAMALEWLENSRGDFSVLVHSDTGDDIRDHTDGVRWMGRELPLDFGFFRLIQKRPELRIHPA